MHHDLDDYKTYAVGAWAASGLTDLVLSSRAHGPGGAGGHGGARGREGVAPGEGRSAPETQRGPVDEEIALGPPGLVPLGGEGERALLCCGRRAHEDVVESP